MTEPRIPYRRFAGGAQAMGALHRAVVDSGLEPTLLELVRVRASQLNGCAYCIDLHSRDALAAGEPPERLLGLAAWRETPRYTDRERAALALTDAVTLIAEGGVADDVLDDAEQVFTPAEMAALLYAIVEINSWNRLAITARTPIGAPASKGTTT